MPLLACAASPDVSVMCSSSTPVRRVPGEGELVTDADCRSNEALTDCESSSQGCADVTQLTMCRLRPARDASLALERAREFHAQAYLQCSGQAHDWNIRQAAAAAAACIEACGNVPAQSRDNSLLAQALMLQANVSAQLDDQLEPHRARSQALRAALILQSLRNPQVGNAMRVMGVVELQLAKRHSPGSADSRRALHKAKKHFLRAILSFREHHLEETLVWSAVSYWDMYIVLQKLGGNGVPWLKRATLLQERIQGKENAYTKLYQQRLAEVLSLPPGPDLHELSLKEKKQHWWGLQKGKRSLACFNKFLERRRVAC